MIFQHWIFAGILVVFCCVPAITQDGTYIIDEEIYFLEISANTTEPNETPQTNRNHVVETSNKTGENHNQTFGVTPDTRSVPDFCFEPVNPGRICQSRMLRYYYNSTLDQCMEFAYAGCYGNDNRFRLKEECEETCKSEEVKIDPRFIASAPMTCRMSVHFIDKCELTSNRSRIVSCAAYPQNQRHERDDCLALGCCWHHSYRLCYNYAEESVDNVGCTIFTRDRSRFYVYSKFQARKYYPLGWVGYLTFNFPVTGEFCMYRIPPIRQMVIIGERFMGNRGAVLQGKKVHYPGDIVEVFSAATLGNIKIRPSFCETRFRRK